MASTVAYTKSGLIDLAIDQFNYLARKQGFVVVDSQQVTKRLSRFTKQQIAEHIEANKGQLDYAVLQAAISSGRGIGKSEYAHHHRHADRRLDLGYQFRGRFAWHHR